MTAEAALARAPGEGLTLADPSFAQCPYPIYERLVAEAPLYLDPVLGFYVATGFEVLNEIIRDTDRFSSVPEGHVMAIYSDHPEVLALYEAAGACPPMNTLVTTDPPEHRRYRALVEQAIGATSARRMTDLITETASSLIDAFADKGHVELVSEFSSQLPVIVLCRLLGVDDGFIPTAHALAASTTRLADGGMLTHQALLENHAVQIEGQKIFETYLDAFEQAPADNLTSNLIHTTLKTGERLTRREIHSIVQALLVGGNDTTPGALSNALLLLARHPEMQTRVRNSPESLDAFIEEALRVESPVQGMYRRATVATEIGGVALPAGAPILIRFAAANRDPAQFDRPAEIDLDRPRIRSHMAFGSGIHYCVGNVLARLEIKIALGLLLDRLNRLSLDPPQFEVRYVDKLAVRNPEALPLSFSAVRR